MGEVAPYDGPKTPDGRVSGPLQNTAPAPAMSEAHVLGQGDTSQQRTRETLRVENQHALCVLILGYYVLNNN